MRRLRSSTRADFTRFSSSSPCQCKVIIASWLYILAMDGLSKLTANELKSQRARERYTALSVEEKGALVQRNLENRERKNSASTSGTACAILHTYVFLHT
uniref:Sulfotransferase n=1 Tax=Oryza barthii TaxID=65489 RepID=A0A0D3GIV4_9ORYZ